MSHCEYQQNQNTRVIDFRAFALKRNPNHILVFEDRTKALNEFNLTKAFGPAPKTKAKRKIPQKKTA